MSALEINNMSTNLVFVTVDYHIKETCGGQARTLGKGRVSYSCLMPDLFFLIC